MGNSGGQLRILAPTHPLLPRSMNTHICTHTYTHTAWATCLSTQNEQVGESSVTLEGFKTSLEKVCTRVSRWCVYDQPHVFYLTLNPLFHEWKDRSQWGHSPRSHQRGTGRAEMRAKISSSSVWQSLLSIGCVCLIMLNMKEKNFLLASLLGGWC